MSKELDLWLCSQEREQLKKEIEELKAKIKQLKSIVCEQFREDYTP